MKNNRSSDSRVLQDQSRVLFLEPTDETFGEGPPFLHGEIFRQCVPTHGSEPLWHLASASCPAILFLEGSESLDKILRACDHASACVSKILLSLYSRANNSLLQQELREANDREDLVNLGVPVSILLSPVFGCCVVIDHVDYAGSMLGT